MSPHLSTNISTEINAFAEYPPIKSGEFCNWSYGTVGQILNDRVYTGELTSLKTETTNCKTKRRAATPEEKRIITPNAHAAIITRERFDRILQIRAEHNCPISSRRYNLFRGLLYCECCGHPLTISKKQLQGGVKDMYFCMYHYKHPDICPKTHRIYHEMLYSFVLEQLKAFARTMKRRKVNSPIKDFVEIEKLTSEILNAAVERIEISHVRYNSKPGNVIHIYWKLK